MKVALVHDYLGEFGGAERVLLALSDMYPEAPIYTAFWRPGDAYERFRGRDIRVSWAHHVPGFSTALHSPLRFLAPNIWGSFDFSGYDLVISSASWYVTKGFGSRGTNRKNPVEICYCHTPPRWLYGYQTSKQNSLFRTYGTFVGFFMRQYDYNAAQRVNYFIANSEETKKRIEKFYRRDAEVIYPPITVNVQQLTVNRKKSYFLIVSRLAQPKHIEIAIESAKKLSFDLKIVGIGPDEARLRAIADDHVEFLGHVPDVRLPELYAGAHAFLALATDEDFGMTPVEAMAMGTPVIAYRGGGYTESVLEGKTGIFFDRGTPDALSDAIKRLRLMHISTGACRARAQQFSLSRFRKEFSSFVAAHCSKP